MTGMAVSLPPVADPLGEALHFLRMSGIFYCRSEFSAPWALELPPMESFLMLHVVTSGECWLEVEGEARLLNCGDLALVPHGLGHVLASGAGLRGEKLFELHREQVSDRYETLRLGGGGAASTMICGAFQFEHPAAYQLMRLLPRMIIVDALDADWIQGTVSLLASEAQELRPGGETIITRLADVLVIYAIRSWMTSGADVGWIRALRDPQIGRVIVLIHREPARDWSLELLADEAAMSRSAFAARFTELVGEPAMQYVTRWRMHTALSRLRADDGTVGDVARGLGYESEAAFSRAFKRFMGVSPGMARRTSVEQKGRELA